MDATGRVACAGRCVVCCAQEKVCEVGGVIGCTFLALYTAVEGTATTYLAGKILCSTAVGEQYEALRLMTNAANYKIRWWGQTSIRPLVAANGHAIAKLCLVRNYTQGALYRTCTVCTAARGPHRGSPADTLTAWAARQVFSTSHITV